MLLSRAKCYCAYTFVFISTIRCHNTENSHISHNLYLNVELGDDLGPICGAGGHSIGQGDTEGLSSPCAAVLLSTRDDHNQSATLAVSRIETTMRLTPFLTVCILKSLY